MGPLTVMHTKSFLNIMHNDGEACHGETAQTYQDVSSFRDTTEPEMAKNNSNLAARSMADSSCGWGEA